MLKLFAFIKIVLFKKIPAVLIIIISVAAVWIMRYFPIMNKPQAIPMIPNTNLSVCDDKLRMIRNDDYSLTKPLLLVDIPSESQELSQIKTQIESEIAREKESGRINAASVYLRQQNGGHWISVNGSETFSPGSLIKVPVLITYLKLAEQNPAWLTKEITFIPREKIPVQTFNEKAIVPGKKYTVKELLHFMIAYSDNNATYLLNENLDIGAFTKLFTDVGLNIPNVRDTGYKITAVEYSRFFRILYNSSYLTPEHSDFALNLLTQTTFNKGIVNPLPSTLKVAHKFGETGTKTTHQLHETAIVYNGTNPYLLTIMTKGDNVDILPEVISNISNIVYKAEAQ